MIDGAVVVTAAIIRGLSSCRLLTLYKLSSDISVLYLLYQLGSQTPKAGLYKRYIKMVQRKPVN